MTQASVCSCEPHRTWGGGGGTSFNAGAGSGSGEWQEDNGQRRKVIHSQNETTGTSHLTCMRERPTVERRGVDWAVVECALGWE